MPMPKARLTSTWSGPEFEHDLGVHFWAQEIDPSERENMCGTDEEDY